MKRIFLISTFIYITMSININMLYAQSDVKKPSTIVEDAEGNIHHGGLIIPEGWQERALLEGRFKKEDILLQDTPIPETYDPRGTMFDPTTVQSQNQGSCGSCYAFAGASTVFYSELINYVRLIGGYSDATQDKVSEFAKTQLRAPNVGMRGCTSYGCAGGWYDAAFKLYASKGGALVSDRPYSRSSFNCNFLDESLKIESWGFVGGAEGYPKLDEVKKAIAVYGAAAIAVKSSCLSRNKTVRACRTKSFDHAVTAIGWINDTLIIQNSWDSNYNSYYYYKGNPYAVAYVKVKNFYDEIKPEPKPEPTPVPIPDNTKTWIAVAITALIAIVSLAINIIKFK